MLMNRLMRVVLAAYLLCGFMSVAAAPEPVADDKPKTREHVSWHLGLTLTVPSSWRVIEDSPDALIIGEKATSLMNSDDNAMIRLHRRPVPEGENAKDYIDKAFERIKADGADVRQVWLAERYDAYAFSRRSEYFHVEAGVETRGASLQTVAVFAHDNEVVTMIWQYPEAEGQQDHAAAFKSIVHSIKVDKRGEGDWPIPEEAVRITELPYEFKDHLLAGDGYTFVLPNGKTFGVWALQDSGIAEQRSKSGILSSIGYRAFFTGPFVMPGEEKADNPYNYLKVKGVSTGGRDNTRTRQLRVDIYDVQIVEDLNAVDHLPIRMTVREAAPEDKAE